MHGPLPKRAGSVYDRTTRRTQDACGNVERMHLPFPVSRRCFATRWRASTPGSRERGQYLSPRCGRWASCWMKDMRLKQGCTSLAVGSLWWISCPCPRERAHLPTMRDERWADPFTFVIYGEDAPSLRLVHVVGAINIVSRVCRWFALFAQTHRCCNLFALCVGDASRSD